MKLKRNATISALAALWLCSAPASAALVFNIDFGQDSIFENAVTLNVDQVIWADVYVSNVPSPGLIAMGFDLVYDGAQLRVLSASIGGNWDFGQIDQASPSVIETGGMLLNTLAGDNILLGSVEFKAIAAGSSGLSLFDSDHGGSFDDFVLDDATVMDSDLNGGVPLALVDTPTPPASIPEPGTLLLLLPGLAGLSRAKKTIAGEN